MHRRYRAAAAAMGFKIEQGALTQLHCCHTRLSVNLLTALKGQLVSGRGASNRKQGAHHP